MPGIFSQFKWPEEANSTTAGIKFGRGRVKKQQSTTLTVSGFGETEASDPLAGDERPNELLLLRRRAELGDGPGEIKSSSQDLHS